MGDWTNDHIQLINVITTHKFGSGHRDFECPVLHLPNCAANPADRIPLSLIRAVKKHLVHHGLYNEQNHQASKLKSIFHQMYLYARWIYIYISPRWTSSQDLYQDPLLNLSHDVITIWISLQISLGISSTTLKFPITSSTIEFPSSSELFSLLLQQRTAVLDEPQRCNNQFLFLIPSLQMAPNVGL